MKMVMSSRKRNIEKDAIVMMITLTVMMKRAVAAVKVAEEGIAEDEIVVTVGRVTEVVVIENIVNTGSTVVKAVMIVEVTTVTILVDRVKNVKSTVVAATETIALTLTIAAVTAVDDVGGERTANTGVGAGRTVTILLVVKANTTRMVIRLKRKSTVAIVEDGMARMVMIILTVVIQMTTPMTVALVEDEDERRINIAVDGDTALITLTTATAASLEGEEDVTVVMTVMKVHMIVVLMLNQSGVKKEEEGEGGEEVQVIPTQKDLVKMEKGVNADTAEEEDIEVVTIQMMTVGVAVGEVVEEDVTGEDHILQITRQIQELMGKEGRRKRRSIDDVVTPLIQIQRMGDIVVEVRRVEDIDGGVTLMIQVIQMIVTIQDDLEEGGIDDIEGEAVPHRMIQMTVEVVEDEGIRKRSTDDVILQVQMIARLVMKNQGGRKTSEEIVDEGDIIQILTQVITRVIVGLVIRRRSVVHRAHLAATLV